MTNFEVLLEALKENKDDYNFGEIDEIFYDNNEFKTINGDYYLIFHENQLEIFIENEIDNEIYTIKQGLNDIPFVLGNLNENCWEGIHKDIVDWFNECRECITNYYMSYEDFIILKY